MSAAEIVWPWQVIKPSLADAAKAIDSVSGPAVPHDGLARHHGAVASLTVGSHDLAAVERGRAGERSLPLAPRRQEASWPGARCPAAGLPCPATRSVCLMLTKVTAKPSMTIMLIASATIISTRVKPAWRACAREVDQGFVHGWTCRTMLDTFWSALAAVAAAAVVRLIATEFSLQDSVMSQVSGAVAAPVQTIDRLSPSGKRWPKAGRPGVRCRRRRALAGAAGWGHRRRCRWSARPGC